MSAERSEDITVDLRYFAGSPTIKSTAKTSKTTRETG